MAAACGCSCVGKFAHGCQDLINPDRPRLRMEDMARLLPDLHRLAMIGSSKPVVCKK